MLGEIIVYYLISLLINSNRSMFTCQTNKPRKGRDCMNRLPGLIILDFCEWIKRNILSKAQYTNIDMWDLLFDEKYDKLLLEKAEEYCDRERKQNNYSSRDNIKKIINEIMVMYYASDDFQDLCYRVGIHKMHDLGEHLFHEFEMSLKHFWYTLGYKRLQFLEEISDYDMRHLAPYSLIDNLRKYYRDSLSNDQEQNPFLQLMIAENAIEIEFLEWIEQENIGKEAVEKIDLMPIDVFEKYAHCFCESTGNGISSQRKLVKSFKQSASGSLLSKLRNLLPYDSAYRKRTFRYVSQRYFADKAIYKCVLLPIKADYDKFHELVVKRWKDLNDTSANYLDIYYCFANYGESGHDLMKQLHYLPEKYHAKLPCILIWKEKMDEARCIPINELSVEDVYYMMAGNGGIVDLIIEGKTLNEIVEGVNDMGEERRNKSRPFNKYVQNANGATNVQQSMVIDSIGTTILGEIFSENMENFVKEIEEAIDLVASSELNDTQKKEVQSILEEAKESYKEKSKEKALSSKKRFSTFLAFAGNAATKLITTLAGLTTIAKFFGI